MLAGFGIAYAIRVALAYALAYAGWISFAVAEAALSATGVGISLAAAIVGF